MRRLIRLAAGIGLTLVLGAVGSLAYADSPHRKQSLVRVSEFSGHIVFCAPMTDPIDIKMLPGGVQIVTFQNIGNIWLTGNPLVDGVEENISQVRFDPNSPTITAKIRGKVDVAALDGKWKFRQRLTVGPDGESSFGVGLGFGDLRGSLLFFETGTGGPVENSPCGVPFGVPITGKIISFAWTG
jgi:hypothetical protein